MGIFAAPPEPVVSISETDTNQTVLGGNNADFDIHIDAGTAGPDANMTFSYNIVDPSARRRPTPRLTRARRR